MRYLREMESHCRAEIRCGQICSAGSNGDPAISSPARFALESLVEDGFFVGAAYTPAFLCNVARISVFR
jgi:hypothetical protein